MKTTVIILAVLIAGAAPAVEESTREISPMMQEIQANFESARAEVAELLKRHEAAISSEEKLQILREAAEIKRESRIEMMRIQLRYARQDGKEELVAELEDIIAKMTAPPLKGEPVHREGPKQ